MKPMFHVVKFFHYSSNPNNPSYKSAGDVFEEIGYDFEDLTKRSSQYNNTCAIRMSLALLKTGVVFSGRLRIKEGKFKGRSVEPGAKLLADELRKPHLFGKPMVFSKNTGVEQLDKALKEIGPKKGIILFHAIYGGSGGHIDLYESSGVCNSDCYFSAREIWFWPLA